MTFQVPAEMAGMSKACFTHSADERLLASVSANVNCQITGGAASVRTHFTCEWFLTGVSAHVLAKMV